MIKYEVAKTLILFVGFLFLSHVVLSASQCKPIDLRCEYLRNPMGIDFQHPRLSWKLDDERRGARQTAYQILVASDSMKLLNGKADLWDSGKILSDKTNNIKYKGKDLRSREQYYWKVIVWDKDNVQGTPSAIACWETGVFNLKEWDGDWITGGKGIDFKPAPYFRKEIELKDNIKRARAYITGLGYFEFSINGHKVGNQHLAPAYSNYNKNIYYSVFDIGTYLRANKNALGIVLGNGWYNEQSRATWDFHKAPWRDRPKFLLNLYLEYENGETELIVSDTTWRVFTGPITFNNIYSGDYYDARQEHEGWDRPGFDDSGWEKAEAAFPGKGRLKAQLMPPIRVTKEITPVSYKKFNDYTYVFDMGQNFAGFSRLRVSGEKGTTIQLRHGEVLDENGRLNNKRISVHYHFEDTIEMAQTDRFVLSGEGNETFTQHFNYHGYRYIEIVADHPINLNKNSITGLVAHTDLNRVGGFSCSNPLMNRIYDAGMWSYVSNLYGIPTDCPHREKNGWTGDGHAMAEVGMYNFDAILFYEKWLRDYIAEQQPSGELPSIVPSPGWGFEFGNGPAWDSGLILIPWYVYLHYGDDTLIKRYYENYKLYVDYLTFRAKDHLQFIGLGDWSPYKTHTPAEFTSSCYYYVDALLLSKYADMNDHFEDAKQYAELAEKIKQAINDKFFDAEKKIYSNGSQTALSAALYQEVVPREYREEVAANLKKKIQADNDHLDVGFLGSKYLLNALTDNGYNETAYKIASQKTNPSWGWWLLQGETTFQEGWGLGPSRNHIFMGEILVWMQRALAGINEDPEDPGFDNIIIKPHFVEELDFVQASIQSVHGTILTKWERTKNGMLLNLKIPPNATAIVYLPVASKAKVYEGGKELENIASEFISYSGTEGNRQVYKVAAGEYHFEIR